MCTRIKFLVILVILLFTNSCVSALKCRTDDGLSEMEFKRIARTCMRKVTEGVPYTRSGSRHRGYSAISDNNNFGRSDLNHPIQTNNGQQMNSFDYEDSEYNPNFRQIITRNNNDDKFRQYNQYERENSHNHNPDMEYDMHHYQRNHSGPGTVRNIDRSHYDEFNVGNNQKSNINMSSNNRKVSSSKENRSNNANNTIYDAVCVVHCFFEEMNVLNSDDYPDKHKTQYILTKDIRDRDLRNFYTDSVQECFRLMESQRRRDKCQFSRELVHCLMEYARASCEDWEEYNVMFN